MLLIKTPEIKVVVRQDGATIAIDELNLNPSETKIVKSAYFPSVSFLISADKEKYKELINNCVTKAYISLNFNVSDKDQTETKKSFYKEIEEHYGSLTINEVEEIFRMGIRGQLNFENEKFNHFSVVSWSKWVLNYNQRKEEVMIRFVNELNSFRINETNSNKVVDYSKTYNQINEILSKRKSKEIDLHLELIKFTNILPVFIYKSLLAKKCFDKDFYKAFLETAKNHIKLIKTDDKKELINEYVTAKEFRDERERLLISKAQQLSIISFLMKKSKI